MIHKIKPPNPEEISVSNADFPRDPNCYSQNGGALREPGPQGGVLSRVGTENAGLDRADRMPDWDALIFAPAGRSEERPARRFDTEGDTTSSPCSGHRIRPKATDSPLRHLR